MHTVRMCSLIMAIPSSKERHHHAKALKHWATRLEVFVEIDRPLVAVSVLVVYIDWLVCGYGHRNIQDIVTETFRGHCYYPQRECRLAVWVVEFQIRLSWLS